jgi:hypothetical protein
MVARLYLHYSVESTAKPVKHLSGGKVTPGCGDTCNQVKRSEIQIPIRRKDDRQEREKYGARMGSVFMQHNPWIVTC